MEEYQKDWISKHLVELMENTSFNSLVSAHLKKREIWSDSDKAIIDACTDKYEKVDKFYNLLQQRTGAYEILIEIFEQTKQSGAADILKEGLKSHENSLRLQYQKQIFRKDLSQGVLDALHNHHTKLVVLTSKDTKITLLKFCNDSIYRIKFVANFHYSNQKAIFKEGENYVVVVDRTELQTTINNIKLPNLCKLILITDHNVEEARTLFEKWDSKNYAILQDVIQWKDFHEDYQKELVNQFILFQDRKVRLKDIALISRNDKTSNNLLSSIHEDDLIQMIHGRVPALIESTVPKKPTYYIERKLNSKFNCISPYIFNDAITEDVFLVSNITHQQFEKMIRKPNPKILTSSQFLLKPEDLNCKFVILARNQLNEHFEAICQKTMATTHLLKFSKENECLNWIKTRGNIDLIRKHAEPMEPENRSEESCLKEIAAKRFVCIADTPGMGKSNILYNFAEKISKASPSRFTLFFVLSELMNENIDDINKVNLNKQKIFRILTNHIKSKFTKLYVEAILNCDQDNAEINIEIMFDGLDEVSSNQLDKAKAFLKEVAKQLKCARIWLTTRPHLMDVVEKEFSTLSINICPFSEEDQLDFLVKFWRFEKEYEERTKIFGKGCMEILQGLLQSNLERSLAGIPLQCMLVAEVFKERASEFVKGEDTDLNVNFESISSLYERLCLVKVQIFIRKQGYQNYGRFDGDFVAKILLKRMELIHMRMAMELICPEWLEQFEPFFDSVADASFEEICAYGLVEHSTRNHGNSTSKGILRFLHRTIAEFFVALLQIRLATNAYPLNLISEEARCSLVGTFIRKRLVHINSAMRMEDLNVVKYFLDKLLTNEIIFHLSKTHHINLELKKKLPFQNYNKDNSNNFKVMCSYFISNNLVNILKLLVSCLDSTELEGFLTNIKTVHLQLIYVAVEKGTLQMVEYLATLFTQGKAENYIKNMCFKHNPPIKSQSPIGLAIDLGKYDIAEYMMNHLGFTPDIWEALLEIFHGDKGVYPVVLKSNADTSKTIVHKLNFIRKLSSLKGGIKVLNGIPRNTRAPPILTIDIAPRLIKCLLECGANIRIHRPEFGTVLHHISKMKSSEEIDYHSIVKYYMGIGLDIAALDNRNCTTALGYAVTNKTITISRKTFDVFMDTTSELRVGLTLKFILSEMSGFCSPDEMEKVTNLLVCTKEKTKLLNARDFDGNTALHMLMKAKNVNNTEFEFVLSILLKYGLNPEETNYFGQTPFQNFLMETNLERMRIFSKFPGFCGNLIDSLKLLAYLDYTMSLENGTLLYKLLYVMKVTNFSSAPSDIWTSVYPAIAQLNLDDVKYLFVDLQLKTTGYDLHGNTLLHHVSASSPPGVVKYFLGICDTSTLSIKNSAGDEPIPLAVDEKLERAQFFTKLSETKSGINAWFCAKFQFLQAIFENVCKNLAPRDRIDESTKFLLEYDFNVNSQDISGTTLLHVAVTNQSIDMVKRLVEIYQAKLSIQDDDGNTPLHYAMKTGSNETAHLLLENGADLAIRNNKNLTPTQFSICSETTAYFHSDLEKILSGFLSNKCTTNFLEIIELLLRYHSEKAAYFKEFITTPGSNIISCLNEFGQNLLHIAVINKFPKIVEHSLDPDRILNQQDYHGNTPLHYACKTPFPSIIKSLLENGADTNLRNKFGQSPLEFAIDNGTYFPESDIQFLIEDHGRLDTNSISNYLFTSTKSETPLATKYLQRLQNRGVNIHQFRDENGAYLHHVAVKCSKLTYLKELIEDLNFNIHATDFDSNTLLHYALLHLLQPMECISYLLQKKIDPKAKNLEGYNALDYAFIHQNVIRPEVLEAFLEHGIQPTVNIRVRSVLNLFISGKMYILKKLYNIERHVNQQVEKTGCTFIHDLLQCNLSSKHTNFILQYLVEQLGASVNTADNEGNTPLHYALRFRNNYDEGTFQVIYFLLFHGADISSVNNSKLTPLMYMLEHVSPNFTNKQRDSIQNLHIFLVDSGADPNLRHPETGDTLLHSCSKLGLHKGVRYLVEQKRMNLNSKNYHDKTPLQLVIENASNYHLSIIEYFIEKGCQPNPNSFNSLLPLLTLKLIDTKFPEVLKLERVGALEMLFRNGRYSRAEFCSIAKFWIEKGCSIQEKLKPHSRTFLQITFWNPSIDLLIPVKYLVNVHNIDVNAQDEFGNTALHYAVQLPSSRERNKILRFLIQNGADVNIKNKIGFNPISYLFHIIHLQIENVINEKNASLDEDEYLPTSEKVLEGYRKGVKSGKAEDAFNEYDLISVLRIFKDSQVDLNEKHCQGETILEMCLRIGLPNVTRFLISVLGSTETIGIGDEGSHGEMNPGLVILAENCFFHDEPYRLLYHLKFF